MRLALVVTFCFLFVLTQSLMAQDDGEEEAFVDKVRFHFDLASFATFYKFMGPANVGSTNLTVRDNREFTSKPVYENSASRALGLNLGLHVGVNIPFYRAESWSVGASLNAGLAQQLGLGAEINSITLDFPQFFYFRKNGEEHSWSALAGFQQNFGPVNYGICLIGADYNLGRSAIRIWLSPYPRSYYYELSNGDLKTAIKVMTVGAAFVY